MTAAHRRIRDSWFAAIRSAIALGDGDAAFNLTVHLVRRLRDLGVSWNR